MRIRKRRGLTTTSAGGGPNPPPAPPPPPPPPPQQCCHDSRSTDEHTVVGRCQYHRVQAESLRSELVGSAAPAHEKKKEPNCTTGAAATTTAVNESTYNYMSLVMGEQKEASTMQGSRRSTVATSQLTAGHTNKVRISTLLEEGMKFSTLLSSRSEPNYSGSRPAAASVPPVLPGQSKHEDQDVNVESELGGTPRHILSNWVMPSLQGLRRWRSRFNYSDCMQKLQNDALAGTNSSTAYKLLQDEAQVISMRLRSDGDGSIMQGVQQACRQTTNSPEVAVRTAGPHNSKLPFTRVCEEEIAALGQMNMKMDVEAGKIKKKLEQEIVMGHNADDQKRETLLRSSICSSGGSKQLLRKSDKGKRSFQGADGKMYGYIIGSYGIMAHRSQFSTLVDGSDDQINQHEEVSMVTRGNEVGDGDVLENQILRPSPSSINPVATASMNNSIIKKCEIRTDDYMIAAVAGRDKLGKDQSNSWRQISTTDDVEARRMKTKLGGGLAAGTSSRWRKKCRPLFRSISDIQRRGPLIHHSNSNNHHHHHRATASGNIDHIITDGSARISDHREDADTTHAHDHHHASTTTTDIDTQRPLNVHHREYGGRRPDDDVGLTTKKKKKRKLNKMNLMMTIMDVVADAAAHELQEQALVISRPSTYKTCKAAHHHRHHSHHPRHHLPEYVQEAQRRQPGPPDRQDGRAASDQYRSALPAVQLNIGKSFAAHPHQAGDNYDVMSRSMNCRCSLNSDPFEWRPDFSHFI